MLDTVLQLLRLQGFETEVMHLADKTSCTACFACKDAGQCILTDDCNGVFEAVCSADGFVLGSPVYSADVSSKMKAFLERGGVLVAMHPGMLKYKVGAAVASVRRAGGMHAVDTMNHFLLNKEVIVPGSTYWNVGYGNAVGDVASDAEGMRNMQNLGENMAWTLNRLRK